MNSLRCAQKMLTLAPKCCVASSANKIPLIYLPSQTNETPAPFNRSTEVVDRLMFSWFDNAWNKTKNTVLDNWESAGLIKKRKPDDESRKRAGTTLNVDRGDNTASSADALTKAKSKAQRHLAENWDAIKQANAKTSQNIVDNAKEGATTTIDELAKSVRDAAGKLIDETTKDLKSKINEKAHNVREKIPAVGRIIEDTTKNIKSEIKDKADNVKEKISTGNLDESTKGLISEIKGKLDDSKKPK